MEGKGGMAALGAALLACGALATTGCRPDGVATPNPERDFAPLVRLHPDERWPPIAADWFLDRSALWFAQAEGCGDMKIAVGRKLAAQWTGAVDWMNRAWIGKGPDRYARDSYDETCKERRPYLYAAHQRTRPHDPTDRVVELGLTEGFYLDLMDWARRGPAGRAVDQAAAISAPAYVERRAQNVDGEPGLRLSYWLLYGFNEPRGAPGPIGRPTHEGDWERIDVLLQDGDDEDEYVPVAVRLPAGDRAHEVPWASVERRASRSGSRTHPILTAALGDHRLSPTRGRNGCRDCANWATWRKLVPVRRQPWYGFGGAWGEAGDTLDTTGPLGPHGGRWPPDPPRAS